jgi:hypothetical protein
LGLLTLEDSLAHTVERDDGNAPRTIQEAVKAELKSDQKQRRALLKSKNSSQFIALTIPIAAKTFESFELLTQYEEKQCGGTTTYSGMTEATSGQSSTSAEVSTGGQ